MRERLQGLQQAAVQTAGPVAELRERQSQAVVKVVQDAITIWAQAPCHYGCSGLSNSSLEQHRGVMQSLLLQPGESSSCCSHPQQ